MPHLLLCDEFVIQMQSRQGSTGKGLHLNSGINHPLFPVGTEVAECVPTISHLNLRGGPLFDPRLVLCPNEFKVGEEKTNHSLAPYGRLPQAEVTDAVHSSAHLCLDDPRRLAQDSYTKILNAIKCLPSQEDLGPSQLQSGYGATSAKVQSLELS